MYKTSGNFQSSMSHRILKTGISEPRGVLTDAADMAESYWYWAKNKLMSNWHDKDDLNWKRNNSNIRKEWSTYKTSNVVVHHANDDDAAV